MSATRTFKALGKTSLLVVPPEPPRKTSHLVLISHRGGGWYTAECMGDVKACRSGECVHARGMRWSTSARPIRQVPRRATTSAPKQSAVSTPSEQTLRSVGGEASSHVHGEAQRP